VKSINNQDAKTHLSRILERVAQGGSVIVAKAGKPVAVLGPYKPRSVPRKPGRLKAKVVLSEGFDAANSEIADLGEAIQNEGFEHLPISFAHTQDLLTLPPIHRDPIDRMLVAQSRIERLQLLTVDRDILKYPAHVIAG
jgi:prevent-host-death family protein